LSIQFTSANHERRENQVLRLFELTQLTDSRLLRGNDCPSSKSPTSEMTILNESTKDKSKFSHSSRIPHSRGYGKLEVLASFFQNHSASRKLRSDDVFQKNSGCSR